MTTDNVTSRTAAFLDGCAAELEAAACDGAARDAANFVDPAFGLPTPGQARLCSVHCRAQAALPAVQDAESADHARVISERKRAVAAWTSYDPREPLPSGAPGTTSWRVHLGFAGVAAAIGAETYLLKDPIDEVLQAGEGIFTEGLVAGLGIAAIIAGLAHRRSQALEELTDGRPEPRARRTASARARAYTGLVIAAGATAVLARIYAAELAGSLDQYGVAFFVGLQVILVGVALALPGALVASVRADRGRRAAEGLDAAVVDLEDAERRRDHFDDERQRQPDQLAALAAGALRLHMQVLADTVDDTLLADRWRAAQAAVHRDGRLRELVADTGTPGPVPLAPVHPSGGDVPAADLVAKPEPDDDTTLDPGPRPADERAHDLLDDIFDRRDP